jgi:hypothetical protein
VFWAWVVGRLAQGTYPADPTTYPPSYGRY